MKYLIKIELIVIIFLVGGLQKGLAQPNDFSWTPEKMLRLPTISNPVISADGQYIAYGRRKAETQGDKSDFITHLWLMKSDGSMNRQFTYGSNSVQDIHFIPDSKGISFITTRTGKKPQIYLININGGEAKQLTHTDNGVNSYKWSPDGNRIAYTMTDPKNKEQKKREKEKRDVILVDKNYRFNRLYVQTVNRDSSKDQTTQLTTQDFQVDSFDWTPNGKTLVFSHRPNPRMDSGSKSNISWTSADSGAVHDVVSWPGSDASPHVSPNGDFIVFQSSGGQPEPVGLTDIYRVPLSGGNPTALAHTPNRSASIIGFKSQGDKLLVQEVNHTFSVLYELPVSGSNSPQLLTKKDGVYSNFDLSDGGDNLVFTYEQPETPPNIYVSNLNKFHKKQLTHMYKKNKFPPMGRTSLIHWTSKDGKKIEGLLTYPANYKRGEKYPLILNVHGGPGGVFTQSWTGGGSIYPIQYFASNGFAILRVNPRGSTGYGKAFRYSNVRDWGFGDYQDLMSGVDKVIDMDVANPDKLVEMGWSYGGYMTSLIVTRTDRFKAVSMGAGLPDLISLATTSAIHPYLVSFFGGYPWKNDKVKEGYEKSSAIFHVKNVSTPVQIFQGVNDKRVPVTQAEEFYGALKKRGIDTELIEFPRSRHVPREPKFIAYIPHHIMDWFKKYLNK